jgi:putative peptidoglycan lipid II flippase
MIKKLSEKIISFRPSSSISSAALVISVAGILSRVLGLLRDRILASQFGAGDTLDVYYAAFRVPDLLYNLLILGALSAAFIPVFTGLIARNEEKEAWKLADSLLNAALLALVLISGLMVIFTPSIMKIVTPGFSGEKLAQVVMLTRIMFLSPIFLGISGIFGGILNSFKRFLIYSLAPIMYNLGIIVGAVFFVPYLGIIGLAWGVVLGALLHMLIQYPAVKISGFRYRFILDFKNHHLQKVLKLMIPRTMGLAVTQVNLLVVTVIASTLAAGSLSIFNFANNLQSFPLGIFAIPFALAVFPTLSHFSAKDDRENFIASFSQTFRQILFFVIPASVLILVLRAQIVRVVLGS